MFKFIKMGAFKLFSGGNSNKGTINSNPNPSNYKILKHEQISKYLIVEIHYPDSKNYEGVKILVFENCTIEDLQKQKLIDPHFLEDKNIYSPIARFVPTKEGWNLAINLCRIL